MAILNDFRLLLLGMWFGAAVFFSVVVAPAAFAVTRSFQLQNASEIAGGIVTRTLSVVNTSGFVVAILLMFGAFAFWKTSASWSKIVELAMLGVVALTTGVGQWVIAARMHALRAAAGGPIDQLAANDPTRVAFNTLHGYSVKALGVGMIAALIAFFLIAYRARLNS